MPHNVLAPDGEVCEAHTCQTIISLSLSWRQRSSFRQEVGFVENRKYSWYHIYGWMSQCDKPLKHCVTFVWFLSYALTRNFIRYNLIRSMCTLWSGWCVYIHYIFLKYISRAQKKLSCTVFLSQKMKTLLPFAVFSRPGHSDHSIPISFNGCISPCPRKICIYEIGIISSICSRIMKCSLARWKFLGVLGLLWWTELFWMVCGHVRPPCEIPHHSDNQFTVKYVWETLKLWQCAQTVGILLLSLPSYKHT